MSHPNNTGNGCSLEDCHTNLFALADLAGIKWRKMKTENQYCVDPLDDPVLLSFMRCIQSDILCVWQRVKPTGNEPKGAVDQLACSKELWVFWYGDEPFNMSQLIAPELQEVDSGSWDQGLSYECRALLFKALHNLIERCLLSQNFVRLGKWFVQPFDHLPRSSSYDKSAHLSIQFSFFLHGESTVCTGIDVRQHPPLWRLEWYHLHMASPQQQTGTQQGLPVILAPYGLAGTLTGHTFKESDPTTQKILEDWKHFFVVPDPETWECGDQSAVPKVVEVIVAGVRMRYPASYILVTGETEAEIIRQHGGSVPLAPVGAGLGGGGAGQVNRPVSPDTAFSTLAKALTGSSAHNFEPVVEPSGGDLLSGRLLDKVGQDGAVTSGVHAYSRHQTSDPSEAEATGQWDFSEPLQRNLCACSKSKGSKSRGGGPGSTQPPSSGQTSPLPAPDPSEGEKPAEGGAGGSDRVPAVGEKAVDKERGRKNTLPYHRRNLNLQSDHDLLRDMDYMMQRLPARNVGSYKGSPAGSAGNTAGGQNTNTSSSGNTATGASTGGGLTPRTGFEGGAAGADSPNSAAPSPLVANQIHHGGTASGGGNVSNGDPTMPTLSPQPLSVKTEQKDPSILNGDVNGESVNATQIHGTNGVNGASNLNIKTESGLGGSLYQTLTVNTQADIHRVDHAWLDAQRQRRRDMKGVKRPVLPKQGYETHDEDEMNVDSLYNFDTLNAWLEYPVKRKRTESADRKPFLSPTGNNNQVAGTQQLSGSKLVNGQIHGQSKRLSGGVSLDDDDDPYAFSEEASSGGVGGFRGTLRSSHDILAGGGKKPLQNGIQDDENITFKDEPKSSLDLSPLTPGTGGGAMLREEDFAPKFEDLDKMFDTSDSDNDDNDPFPMPSPPKSVEDKPHLTHIGGHHPITSGPTPGELAIMFPTPPSLDNQHNLSPGLGPDGVDHYGGMEAEAKVEAPQEPLKISDYSFVYKPPTVVTFVGSTKYSPIELPSNQMEPLKTANPGPYRPSWQQYQHSLINKQSQSQTSHYSSGGVMSGADTGSIMPVRPPHSHHHTPPSHHPPPHPPPHSSHLHPPTTPAGTFLQPDTSPAHGGPRSAHTPRTPMSYVDLQSPASNASSYIHNLRSVATNSAAPEVNSIVVNIMLSDSLLNLFKDQNFDSCTICVCNMNIRGADVGLYLPDKSGESQYRCTCGFSAVVNRKYGANSGLFYEDEVDITGIRDERLEQRKPNLLTLMCNKDTNSSNSKNSAESGADNLDTLPQDLLLLLQSQFNTIYPSYTVSRHCGPNHSAGPERMNMLEMADGCEACYSALEVGRQAMDNCTSSKLEDQVMKNSCIHRWPYQQTACVIPDNSQDTLRLLRSLLPLLEDAIQKKRTSRVWESVYRITGPLSWKDFHLLSGRGSDEISEPQPVPLVQVGYDKELLTLSPYALPYWDKFLLEPYGRQRDIAYMVVSPDNDFVLTHVKTFFTDLSREYELCRLGRHRPIAKIIRDGILRVGKKAVTTLASEEVDDWFKALGDTPLASKLRLYSQVCRHQLAPFLAAQGTLDKKDIFEEVNNRSALSPGGGGQAASGGSQGAAGGGSSGGSQPNRPMPSPGPQTPSPAPPRTPEDSENRDPEKEGDDSGPQSGNSTECDADLDPSETPSVLVYLIDPFTYGAEWAGLRRLAMLGLLRCYHETLKKLPEALQNNVHLQVIPLQSIVDYRDSGSVDPLRSLAMSVHTQCRRLATHTVSGRTLTGFGPAATACDKTVKSEPGKLSSVKLYSPPYILAPPRGLHQSAEARSRDQANVLFTAYCLSEDQRWLLGVCTDTKGEILETCTINVEIPNRNRRKKASARKIGLQKLWDFIVGVLSATTSPWRLVIGRFGRIGHGELKGWAGLLSKKNLARTSRQLKDMCNMCGILTNPAFMPCIQSACLVSMESHGSIHIMPDTLKLEDDRRSSRIALTTPRDASVTHILVMPTSAMAAASQGSPADSDGPQGMDHTNLGEDDFEDDFGIGDIGGDLDIGDLGDIFSGEYNFGGDGNMMADGIDTKHGMPGGPTSPHHLPGGRHSPTGLGGGPSKAGQSGSTSDAQDDNINLLQQPLAMGFYVSTAKTGPLPKWFWSSCPQRENMCPHCFKAALHVNCPNVEQTGHSDAYMMHSKTNAKSSHPLDSNVTCDVLRYVLETYNALSWLTMDASTHDRRSCLPVHFMVLMQLYHAVNTFL